MYLYRGEVDQNADLYRYGQPYFPSTLGESLDASFNDPTLSPTALIGTQMDVARESRPSTMDELRGGRVSNIPGQRARFEPGDIEDREEGAQFRRRVAESELSEELTPEAANEQYGHLGLKFDRPIRKNAAEILADQKREEMIRQDILARAPSGVLPSVARFGAGFVRAAIDPLNVASAFVPVVSQARMAGFIAKYGATRGRAIAGAIEGSVGNALIEPLVYGLSRQQQLDYEMSDALVNVTFGGILGGGLHAVAGRIGDRLKGISGAEREELARAAIAQLADGRYVDVNGVTRTKFEFLDRDNVFREVPDIPPARAFDLGRSVGRGTGATFRNYTPLSERDKFYIRALVEELETTEPGFRVFREQDGQGSTPDVQGVTGSTPDWFTRANEEIRREQRELARLREQNAKLPTEQKREIPSTPEILTRARVRQVADKMIERKPLGVAEARIAETVFRQARDAREANARDILSFRNAREDERTAFAEREMEDAWRIAEREAQPERDITADFEASRRISERETTTEADNELQYALDRLEGIRDTLTPDEVKELDAAAELVKKGESVAAASRMAALCVARNG